MWNVLLISELILEDFFLNKIILIKKTSGNKKVDSHVGVYYDN